MANIHEHRHRPRSQRMASQAAGYATGKLKDNKYSNIPNAYSNSVAFAFRVRFYVSRSYQEKYLRVSSFLKDAMVSRSCQTSATGRLAEQSRDTRSAIRQIAAQGHLLSPEFTVVVRYCYCAHLQHGKACCGYIHNICGSLAKSPVRGWQAWLHSRSTSRERFCDRANQQKGPIHAPEKTLACAAMTMSALNAESFS